MHISYQPTTLLLTTRQGSTHTCCLSMQTCLQVSLYVYNYHRLSTILVHDVVFLAVNPLMHNVAKW